MPICSDGPPPVHIWPSVHTAPCILLTWGLPCSVSLKLDTHALGIRWVSHSGLRPVAMVDGRAGLHPHKRTREPASSLTERHAVAEPQCGLAWGVGLAPEPSSGVPLIGMRN